MGRLHLSDSLARTIAENAELVQQRCAVPCAGQALTPDQSVHGSMLRCGNKMLQLHPTLT